MAYRYKPKICELCGKEYIPTSGTQKYCPECRILMNTVWATEYKKRNPEKVKAYYHSERYKKRKKAYREKPETKEKMKKYREEHKEHLYWLNKEWREKHSEEIAKYMKHWREKHPNWTTEWERKHKEERKKYHKKWQEEHPEIIKESWKKHHNKRKRNLGFNPLNKYFKGSEAHHINERDVIYIPKELHQNISHSLITNKNMALINSVAYQFLFSNYIIYD